MQTDKLSYMKKADITICNKANLADLRKVELNRNESAVKRAESFFEQVHNPYLFRVGETAVKIDFGNGKNFAEMLTDVILAG